jgi:hypothetical protein
MKTSNDFEELFGLLNQNKVRYLVVRGYAYAIHAEPRYTKDIDIFFDRSASNVEKLIEVLRIFGFESLQIVPDDLIEPDRVIQLGYPPLRIDLLSSIDGVEFDGCWNNRTVAKYGNQKMLVIGKDDLIRNKKATGREQDLLDAKNLEKS